MPRLHHVRCAVSLLLVMEGAVVFLLLGPHFPSHHSSPRLMTAQHRASSAPPLNCTISLDHCREDDDHDHHDHHNTNFGDRCSLKELTKDCESFLRAHRYMDTDVRREEREFALAFSVRMHRLVPSVSSLSECTGQCLLCPNAPVSVFSVFLCIPLPLFMFVPHFVAHFQFPLFAPKYLLNFCLFSLPFLVPG